jgi:glycosyltransferase involved in cell wall biosynthesis
VKVVHVVHQYPPEFRGGTEACVQTLTAAQRARGDVPFVVAGSDERHPEGELRLEAVDHVPVCRVLRMPGENYSMDHRLPRVGEQVADLIAREKPGVVHLHHTLNLSGDLAARLAAAGLPVVVTLHDFTTVCARFFLVRPDGESCAGHFPLPSARCDACVLPDFPAGEEALRIEREARAATAAAEAAAWGAAIAPSTIVRDRWLASGLVDAGKLQLIPHAPALGTAPPPEPRLRADGRLVCATWGHLAEAKGVLDLLAALRHAGDPRLALVVLGEPIDADFAEKLIDAAEGLDVTFGGRYETKDLRELAARVDLAVFPSRAEETFGLVVAEAHALGLPVITSDRGALPEGVGEAGMTVPAADPAALAAALRRAADEPRTLEAWRSASRRDVADPATHAERVAAVYARVT